MGVGGEFRGGCGPLPSLPLTQGGPLPRGVNREPWAAVALHRCTLFHPQPDPVQTPSGKVSNGEGGVGEGGGGRCGAGGGFITFCLTSTSPVAPQVISSSPPLKVRGDMGRLEEASPGPWLLRAL